eukprot:1563344-Prymnesium_polylepis.1
MVLTVPLRMHVGIFKQSHVVVCSVTDQLVHQVLLMRKETMRKAQKKGGIHPPMYPMAVFVWAGA